MPQEFYSNVLPLIIVIGAYVLFFMLPNRRRIKETERDLEAAKPGDKIVTYGGIVGRFLSKSGDNIIIETADTKSHIEITRTSVETVVKEARRKPKKSE